MDSEQYEELCRQFVAAQEGLDHSEVLSLDIPIASRPDLNVRRIVLPGDEATHVVYRSSPKRQGGTMDRLSLEPGHWYAVELFGEEFGTEIRSYSPVRVEEITPKGGRKFSLDFYHANYPEGVRSKVYELETVERNTAFILARSLSHTPARLMLIYTITGEWLREHFGIAISRPEDPQAWLTKNA